MERCLREKYIKVKDQFEELDTTFKTTRIRIMEEYGWDKETCNKALSKGHLECLKYAHENGCPWDQWTCSNASKGGHIECLKYAHENGCPWDGTCANASYYGHLECLKYAHENGCPWDQWTCQNASYNGHVRMHRIMDMSECIV